MADRRRVRLSLGWPGLVLLLLGGSLVLALAIGLTSGPRNARQPGADPLLSAVSTPVPTSTATPGWWDGIESELSILATPTVSITVTLTPTSSSSE